MLQAYVDDSGRGQEIFTLAGWIATADKWAALSDEWQALLDEKPKLAEVKMKNLARSKGGLQRAERFYRLIEKYVDAGISYCIETALLERLTKEVFPAQMGDAMDNPWDLALTGILYAASRNQKMLKIDGPVDFIFDEATEKGRCIQGWEMLKLTNLFAAPLMGDTPIFRDSKKVLPLQAGDLFAWWIGEWQKNGMIYGPLNHKQFPWKRERPELPAIHAVGDEVSVRQRLIDVKNAIEMYGPVAPGFEK
jgi:hypothetical protein